MKRRMKVLCRENQHAPRLHRDRTDVFPVDVRVPRPVIQRVFLEARITRELGIKPFISHQRLRFLESEERGSARALDGARSLHQAVKVAFTRSVVPDAASVTRRLVPICRTSGLDGGNCVLPAP